MPTPFTIVQGKEGAQPKKSLFLVTIVAPDGDTCYFTTSAGVGAANLVYGGNTYLARVKKNDVSAIQAGGPQGYSSIPGFTLTIADADKFIWNNHCIPHGWRGSAITLTVVLWDVVANQYSTDALVWSFIGGTAQHDYASGTTTVDVTDATNFTRLKVPSIPLTYMCPWDFPATSAQRAAALSDPSSIYYQCGYSADIAGGVGNLQSGGAAFTTCDHTRSSPTDPSVGCMARMGNASTVSVAPDGDLTHDIAGHYTARFGGVTWLAPQEYSGRAYLTGQKTYGFNQPNTALPGSYYNWVYGTQWVTGQLLAPAGDPNSLRSEVAVCVAAYGPAYIVQVLVNGVSVPYNNIGDSLFTWRYVNQGGRSGTLNADAIFDSGGDPHGSVCVIEFVVPAQLAAGGSVPTVQVLVTSGPIINCYAIASVTSGVVTFTGPNTSCAGNSPFTVIITGNSNPALNGIFALSSWNSTSITLTGTTASGSGGGVFFYQNPDLWDDGGDIVTSPGGQFNNAAGPAANLAFAVLDLMTWGNINISQVDPVSWYNAAQICANSVSYTAPNGTTQTHAQFKASFQVSGTQRQTLAQAITAVRNAGNLMIAPNSTTGLIQCFVKQTLADQQPSAIAGSNDNVARASVTAAGAAVNGYYAYTFNETNIEAGSFKVTATRIESTPNTVSFQFQDEQNGYQIDSLTEVDPVAYAYSGNQEIGVPVPMMGIPNFDQGTRQSNVQIAEALYGNPRNDPGGTLYFEFTTNQRALSLVSRLGYICGLTWQGLGIGLTTPQPIRIISVKPDSDGEHWQIKAAWHNDAWYTYAYGQNPAPFQTNPLLSPPARNPYPWQPGVSIWGSGDALYPNGYGFQCGVDLSSYPAAIPITGNVPTNTQPGNTKPPLVPLQATTANTGGSIKPGTYYVAFSTNGSNGPVSKHVLVVVPSGTNTNTITVSNIQWQSGAAPSIQPYIGTSEWRFSQAVGSSYTGSSPDSNGNPTSYTFTAYSTNGIGLPDINFQKLLVQDTQIAHTGVWADTIISVASNVLTFRPPGGGWTSGQWNGYVLTLLYRPGVVTQPGLNLTVSSCTTTTLTMAAAGFQAGDVVTMRALSGNITSNTIGDTNFNNTYAVNQYGSPGLAINAEAGKLILIVGGKGKWQSPKVIASNTHTVFTINGTWDVTPDATSVFIVIYPTVLYSFLTNTITNYGGGSAAQVASTASPNTLANAVLVSVSAADVNGNAAPVQYQPFREIYVPQQYPTTSSTVVTTTPYAMGVLDQAITFGSGASVVNLQPATAMARHTTWFINASTSNITINAASGDTIEGSASITLPPGTRYQLMPNA